MSIKYILAQIIYWIFFCGIYSFANPYLSDRGFSASLVGSIIAISSIVSVIVQVQSEKLIDKFKNISIRKIIISSILIVIFGAFGILISKSIFSISIYYIILITGLLNSQTYLYTFIFEYINKGYKINFGLARGIGSFSFAMTSLFLGKISLKYGLSFLPILTIVFSIILISILLSFDKIEKTIDISSEKSKTGFIDFVKKYNKYFYVMLAIGFLLFTHNSISTFMKNIVYELDGGNNDILGIGFMLAAMVEIPIMASIVYISSRFGYVNVLRFSALSFMIKCIITLIALLNKSVPIYYIAQITQIGAYAIYLPVGIYYTNSLMEESDRIKGQTYIASFATIGSILGNVLGGVIVEQLSIHILILVCIIVAFLGVCFIWNNLESTNKI